MVNVGGIRVEEAREIGSCLVAEEYWERLKMTEIMSGCGLGKKEIMRAKVEIFGRLISPQSENGTVEWVKRVGIRDIWGNGMDKVSRDGLYRVSDKLIKRKDEIEKSLAEREVEVFGLEEMIYLYDLTSSYFEGECKRNKKAIHGYSRDKRGDCKQVVVGLIIDKEGFIKGHEVYEGNRADIKTIKEVVNKLKEKVRDKGKKPTIIIDRGMVSEKSIEQIKEAGMDYIVTLRQGMRDKYFKEFDGVGKKEIKNASGEKIEVDMKEIGGEKYILCKSEERGKKERGIRERFEERMEEALIRLGRMIERGKIKDKEKIRERIGRIKQKNRRVSRYYEIDVKEEKGVIQLLWERRDEQTEKDGTYLMRTSRVDLGEEEVWKLYMAL